MLNEDTEMSEHKVYAQDVYDEITNAWLDILSSDIAEFAYFDTIHAGDLLFSWFDGKKSKNGRMKNEYLDDTTIKYAAERLSDCLYNVVIDEIVKKDCLRTLFHIKVKRLSKSSLLQSLLYERHRLS